MQWHKKAGKKISIAVKEDEREMLENWEIGEKICAEDGEQYWVSDIEEDDAVIEIYDEQAQEIEAEREIALEKTLEELEREGLIDAHTKCVIVEKRVFADEEIEFVTILEDDECINSEQDCEII